MSYHFGKPEKRPIRWSNQIFKVASIFGEIGLQMCDIHHRLDKKAVLFSFFFLGPFNGLLLRIPKWYDTPWSWPSNPLKTEKKQNLVLNSTSKIGLEATKLNLYAESCTPLKSPYNKLSKMVHHDGGHRGTPFGLHGLQMVSWRRYDIWHIFLSRNTY